MAQLVSVSIDVTKITKSKLKDGKYLNFTVALNNETNEWGKNASVWEEQSKEEREAKDKKNYLGSGKVAWSDGQLVEPPAKTDTSKPSKKKEDLDELLF
jgi:hypothetical protein